MSARVPEPGQPARPIAKLAWLLSIGAALVLWSFLARDRVNRSDVAERRKLADTESAAAAPPREQMPAPKALPRPVETHAPSEKPALALVSVATDGLPYMPASPTANAPTGPVHPHPITPEHARIFRENATIQALNDAMDVKDAKTLRRFLTRYRSEYPEDAQQLQQGYELIADCLEGRAGSRAAAQRYFDEETASSLRRFVLRHCLGGP